MTEKKPIPVLPIIAAAVILLLLLLLGGAYLSDKKQNTASSGDIGKTVEQMMNKTDETAPAISYNGKEYIRKSDVESYLIMGIDREGKAVSTGTYIGGGQADLQLLIVVDNEEKSYSVLHINRDTITKVDVLGVFGDIVGWSNEQIALAHGYGEGMEDSCENAVRAVSNLLHDAEITGYAAVNMDAIAICNDMVGGITVTIEDDFSQMDKTLIKGETITLKGEQSLHYVRGRMTVGDGTNVARMRRQKKYMNGFAEKLRQKTDEDMGFVVEMYDAVQPYTVTDISGKTVSRLAKKCQDYHSNGIITIAGETKIGKNFIKEHEEFYPDEDSLMQTALKLFYTEK